MIGGVVGGAVAVVGAGALGAYMMRRKRARPAMKRVSIKENDDDEVSIFANPIFLRNHRKLQGRIAAVEDTEMKAMDL